MRAHRPWGDSRRSRPRTPSGRIIGLRLNGQPVKKVGAELTLITNRAPAASRSPEYGVFGARSGVEVGIERVFRQCFMALAEPPRSHEDGSVANAIFTPGCGVLGS